MGIELNKKSVSIKTHNVSRFIEITVKTLRKRIKHYYFMTFVIFT